jgi:hypothetical protein
MERQKPFVAFKKDIKRKLRRLKHIFGDTKRVKN